jgi:hypothetical protein
MYGSGDDVGSDEVKDVKKEIMSDRGAVTIMVVGPSSLDGIDASCGLDGRYPLNSRM